MCVCVWGGGGTVRRRERGECVCVWGGRWAAAQLQERKKGEGGGGGERGGEVGGGCGEDELKRTVARDRSRQKAENET